MSLPTPRTETNAGKLICIYARVSTARQEEEQTVQSQLVALREHAAKTGCRIVQEYIEDGWSGDVLARPALDKLREDAKEKTWNGVLIYDPDRLARRYSYQELIMDELREAGIEVMFVTVSAPRNFEEKILHGVRGLFAEYERAKITERFRLGKVRKLKEGHILVSEPLYGYKYIPKKDGRHGYYEINPTEARVVRMIFRWVADEGVTLRAVVRRLQAESVRPRKSKRGVWSTSTLSTLLRNKAYIGEAHWGSSYAVAPQNPIRRDRYRKTKKSSRRMRPEAEWLTVAVPAIVERDLFERARARLEANLSLCIRNKKNQYLLAGKIECTCGCRRSGEGPQNGKHLYYRCNDRVRRFPLPRVCEEKGVNARVADELVWDRIAGLMSSPELLRQQAERWMKAERVKGDATADDEMVLRREIGKLKEQEGRYNRAYGAGLFTMEQLQEYTVPIREQIGALEIQLRKVREGAEARRVTKEPGENEIREFARKASSALGNLNFATKRAIVLHTIDKVVGTKERLQVYGYIPIENHVEVFTNDRHRVNIPRHEFDELDAKVIPFSFEIDLPVNDYRSQVWGEGKAA